MFNQKTNTIFAKIKGKSEAKCYPKCLLQASFCGQHLTIPAMQCSVVASSFCYPQLSHSNHIRPTVWLPSYILWTIAWKTKYQFTPWLVAPAEKWKWGLINLRWQLGGVAFVHQNPFDLAEMKFHWNHLSESRIYLKAASLRTSAPWLSSNWTISRLLWRWRTVERIVNYMQNKLYQKYQLIMVQRSTYGLTPFQALMIYPSRCMHLRWHHDPVKFSPPSHYLWIFFLI